MRRGWPRLHTQWQQKLFRIAPRKFYHRDSNLLGNFSPRPIDNKLFFSFPCAVCQREHQKVGYCYSVTVVLLRRIDVASSYLSDTRTPSETVSVDSWALKIYTIYVHLALAELGFSLDVLNDPTHLPLAI